MHKLPPKQNQLFQKEQELLEAIERIRPMLRRGMSQREIAAKTGIPLKTVKNASFRICPPESRGPANTMSIQMRCEKYKHEPLMEEGPGVQEWRHNEVEFEPPPCTVPTKHFRGTDGRIEVMRKRFAAGLSLWHPKDGE
jgi:hypothetical protein